MSDEAEKINAKWSALLFGVRRSIRYHTRRRKFFDGLSGWGDFLTIITGGTVVAFAAGEAKHTALTAILGAAIAIISALDLVIGFSTKARDYHDLVKEFSELEREMTASDDKRTKENLAAFTNKRLAIEEDEPPILCVLNNSCHNDLCRALGKDSKYYVDIKWYQSWFKQWFDVLPSKMVTHEEGMAKKKALADACAPPTPPAPAPIQR
jgi:hypothetical protein